LTSTVERPFTGLPVAALETQGKRRANIVNQAV